MARAWVIKKGIAYYCGEGKQSINLTDAKFFPMEGKAELLAMISNAKVIEVEIREVKT